MEPPTGSDVVALARAILAAAGNTGHLVVSVEDPSRAIRIRDALAAEGMRERAAFVVRQRDHSGRGAEEYGITADTTDERLDEIEEEIRENLPKCCGAVGDIRG